MGVFRDSEKKIPGVRRKGAGGKKDEQHFSQSEHSKIYRSEGRRGKDYADVEGGNGSAVGLQ